MSLIMKNNDIGVVCIVVCISKECAEEPFLPCSSYFVKRIPIIYCHKHDYQLHLLQANYHSNS